MQRLIILYFYILISSLVFSANVAKFDKIYNFFKDYHPQSLNVIGEKYYKKGVLDSALVCFSIISGRYSLDSDADKKNGLLYANAYNRCGVIYIQYNSYTKALDMLLKGLEVCEVTDNESYMSNIYNNIANVYYVFQDYRMAESYCEKSYKIGLKYNDKKIQKILLNNIIGINCYLQEYSKAREHLEILKSLEPAAQSTFNYYYCISSGAIDLELHNYRKALGWFEKSIHYADSFNNSARLKCVSYSNIAKVYEYTNQYDSALYYLELGKKIAIANQYNDLTFECYTNFSNIYRKIGDEQKSLAYKSEYMGIADSIFNTQEFGRIKDMQFLHEMDKIEKKIYRLNDEQLLKDNQIKFQQIILQVIFGAFVVIVILLIIMYLQNKRLREANVELFNKNVEIIKSEEDQRKNRKYLIENSSVAAALEEPADVENNTQLSEICDNKIKYQNSTVNEEEKKRIREAIQDIMDTTLEYCSIDFNLDKLSSLVNSKSKYVSQIINESYGKNFNLFINEYRIKEARRRLMDVGVYGNYTIAAVAIDVGFKSSSNFNLIFKKVTGITPSVYLEMAKKHQSKLI